MELSGIDFSQCEMTDYQNSWDGILAFQFAVNWVMTGESSYHDNGSEDRK